VGSVPARRNACPCRRGAVKPPRSGRRTDVTVVFDQHGQRAYLTLLFGEWFQSATAETTRLANSVVCVRRANASAFFPGQDPPSHPRKSPRAWKDSARPRVSYSVRDSAAGAPAGMRCQIDPNLRIHRISSAPPCRARSTARVVGKTCRHLSPRR